MTSFLKKFDQFLNRNFRRLGRFVAHHTGYFIVIPILLAFLSGTGVQQATYEANPEYLFSPIDGPAKDEKAFINEMFSMNFSSNFDPSRITEAGRFVRYIVTTKDGKTILRQHIWDEIMELDRKTRSTEIMFDHEIYNYENLCAIWNDKCFENKILGLHELLPEIVNGSLLVDYPVMLNPNNFDVYILSIYFGGVSVKEDTGTIDEAKAVILNYWLKNKEGKDDER